MRWGLRRHMINPMAKRAPGITGTEAFFVGSGTGKPIEPEEEEKQ
jgi:hypothetical protein